MVVVDLTLDGDDDDVVPTGPRLTRTETHEGLRGRNRARTSEDDQDCDVVMVSASATPSKRRRTEAGREPNGIHTAPVGDDEDSDCAITGGNAGQVALRDLAHVRPDCVEHKLAEGSVLGNAAHCPQCFCYVCDVPASDCTMWGSGALARDHCNARRGASNWDDLKNLARKGRRAEVRRAYDAATVTAAAAAPPAAAVPAPVPRSTGLLRSSSAAKPTSLTKRPAQHHSAAQPSSKPGSSDGPAPSGQHLPPGLVALPNPAHDPNAMELGSFSLHVKAAKNGATIAELIPKVQRDGFYLRKAPVPAHEYSAGTLFGDRLCLSNIFDSTNHLGMRISSKDSYKYLRIVDEPSAEEAPAPSLQRVRQVTVVDSCGRVAPVVLGVSTVKGAPPAAILAAVRPLLQPPEDGDAEELLLTEAHQHGYYDSVPRLITDKTELDDAFFSGHQLVLYRLPKISDSDDAGPGTSAAAPPQPAAAVSKYWTGMRATGVGQYPPSHVAILLRQRITRPCPRPPSMSRSLRAAMYGISPFDDDSDDSDGNMYGELDSDDYYELYHGGHHSDSMITEFKKLGSPILLSIPEKHCRSGEEASSFLTRALARALRPFISAPAQEPGQEPDHGRPADDSPTLPPFRLHPGSIHSSYQSLDTPFSVPGTTLEVPNVGGIAVMSAIWDGAESLAACNFEPLEKPAVDPTASKEAMAETLELVQQEHAREAEQRQRNARRWEAIEELKLASARPQISEQHVSGSATIAVSMDLQASNPAEPRQGIITFTVYAWVKDAAGVRTLFQPWDDWGMASRLNDRYPIKHVMKLLMKDVAGADVISSQMDEMHKAHMTTPGMTSVNGLLKFLQTGEREAAPQPSGLTVQLRQYQLQSLQFMLDAEARVGGFRSLFWLQKVNSQGKRFWYSPVLARASLHVPEQPAGGFLAEEMGLGKTVEVLALILAAPPPMHVVSGLPHSSSGSTLSRLTSRATLVVCAVSLVGQWVDEAFSKTGGSLKILQYHGQGRQRDHKKIAHDYDLVVTTYQTLCSDYTRDGKSDTFAPLGQIHWYRIVFDEGHMVKTATTQQSKVCVALSAERRWCCTGTPISTSIEDLLGQFAVVQMAPMNTKMFFDFHIKPAFGHMHRAFGQEATPITLMYTLKQCMIRHTKQQTLAGEVVLQLPPKTQEDLAVSLSPSEQELYQQVFAKVREQWLSFRAAGAAAVTKYQLTIMSLLGPLRRICSGGALKEEDLHVPELEPGAMFKSGHGAAAERVNLTPDTALVSPEAECCICLDTMEVPVVTPCQHWFCRECIMSWLDQKDTCSLCRAKLSAAKLRGGVMPGYLTPPAPADPGSEEAGPSAAAEPILHMCETKLQALLVELRAMRAADASAKALVFSQYNTTLEWLKKRLTEEGFGYRTISGSMPLKQRTKAIEQFQKDPPTTVFLLSMRSGAVGINLTAASHVFIMEPCINAALEEQAVSRSWRMGQKREVVVKRFYTKGSVEESIIKVVKARREVGAGLVGGAGSADTEDAITAAAHALMEEQLASGRRRGGLQRAIAEVVAGNIRSDKQTLRLNELEMLFAPPTFGAAGAEAGPSTAAAAAGSSAAAGGATAAATPEATAAAAAGGTSAAAGGATTAATPEATAAAAAGGTSAAAAATPAAETSAAEPAAVAEAGPSAAAGADTGPSAVGTAPEAAGTAAAGTSAADACGTAPAAGAPAAGVQDAGAGSCAEPPQAPTAPPPATHGQDLGADPMDVDDTTPDTTPAPTPDMTSDPTPAPSTTPAPSDAAPEVSSGRDRSRLRARKVTNYALMDSGDYE